MSVAAFAAIYGPFENLAILNLIQGEFLLQHAAQIYRLRNCAVSSGLLIA